MRVRGLPYRKPGVLRDVHVSMGLWRGCPDIDSDHDARRHRAGARVSVAVREHALCPPRQYFPMSGMNLAFRREVACLLYFPPMGLGQPYCASMTSGAEPSFSGSSATWATRSSAAAASRPSACVGPVPNLVKEAPGIVANEHLWETIERSS